MGRRWSLFHSRQPDTSRSCKTTDMGPVHPMVCPFTPQLSLVLIDRPRSDGTLSLRWYTAAVGGIRTRDLATRKSGTVPLYHCVHRVVCPFILLLPFRHIYTPKKLFIQPGLQCHVFRFSLFTLCQISSLTISLFSNSPSSSIWPHLSYGLVRSKREYYHNCSLVVFLCSFL